MIRPFLRDLPGLARTEAELLSARESDGDRPIASIYDIHRVARSNEEEEEEAVYASPPSIPQQVDS
jgi:hypothetical protein